MPFCCAKKLKFEIFNKLFFVRTTDPRKMSNSSFSDDSFNNFNADDETFIVDGDDEIDYYALLNVARDVYVLILLF